MKHRPDSAQRVGGFVRALHLAEHLWLAEHHGFEAGGDAEKVTDRVGVFAVDERGSEGVGRDACVGGERGGEVFVRRRLVRRSRDEDLHAIAGGEDDGFAVRVFAADVVDEARDAVIVEGDAFAEIDGGGGVVEAEHEDSH